MCRHWEMTNHYSFTSSVSLLVSVFGYIIYLLINGTDESEAWIRWLKASVPLSAGCMFIYIVEQVTEMWSELILLQRVKTLNRAVCQWLRDPACLSEWDQRWHHWPPTFYSSMTIRFKNLKYLFSTITKFLRKRCYHHVSVCVWYCLSETFWCGPQSDHFVSSTLPPISRS